MSRYKERLYGALNEVLTVTTPGATGSLPLTLPAVCVVKRTVLFVPSQGPPTRFLMPRGPPFVLFHGRAAHGPFLIFVKQEPRRKPSTVLQSRYIRHLRYYGLRAGEPG